MEASPILLEPIDDIRITAPEYYMGDVVGRLNSKRARILGIEGKGKDMSEIHAEVPESELYRFATELRSLTQGRGSYTLSFARYEPMPERNAEAVIAASKEK